MIDDEETRQIALRLPLSLIEWLEKQARQDSRTLAALARKILIDRMRLAQNEQHEEQTAKRRKAS
jgi:hypothetical protein